MFHQNKTSDRRDGHSVHGEATASRQDDKKAKHGGSNTVDEENLRHDFNYIDAEAVTIGSSQTTANASNHIARGKPAQFSKLAAVSGWPDHDEDVENDVPASLLVEPNQQASKATAQSIHERRDTAFPHTREFDRQVRAQWEAATAQQQPHHDNPRMGTGLHQPRSLMSGLAPGGRREKALWRWVNISNLDSFMRDVYDYYEGGGLLCILCSNALWLL